MPLHKYGAGATIARNTRLIGVGVGCRKRYSVCAYGSTHTSCSTHSCVYRVARDRYFSSSQASGWTLNVSGGYPIACLYEAVESLCPPATLDLPALAPWWRQKFRQGRPIAHRQAQGTLHELSNCEAGTRLAFCHCTNTVLVQPLRATRA